MSSGFTPDSICDLIVNLFNLLVNILLLWQSQKLSVALVSHRYRTFFQFFQAC